MVRVANLETGRLGDPARLDAADLVRVRVGVRARARVRVRVRARVGIRVGVGVRVRVGVSRARDLVIDILRRALLQQVSKQ